MRSPTRPFVSLLSALSLSFGIGVTTPATAQPRTLVRICPEPSLDYSRLDGLVDIYDHYLLRKGPSGRHRLIGEIDTASLGRLDALALEYQVIEEDAEQDVYWWVANSENAMEEITQRDGVVAFARRDQSYFFVRFPASLSGDDWPHRVEVEPLRFRAIPVDRISPDAYRETKRRHMDPLPDHVTFDPSVDDLLQGITIEDCLRVVRGLTGDDQVTVNGQPVVIGSRNMCDPDHDVAIDWLAEQFTEAGLNVSSQYFPVAPNVCFSGKRYRNLIAEIPGTDLADQAFLVTAHIDSAGGPGADDNASGVAAMLCAAQELAKARYRRTLVFVAFNGEEYGKWGSDAFVDWAIDQAPWEICGAFNMDMIAWDGDGDRRFQVQSNPGDAASAYIRDRLVEVVQEYNIDLNPVAVCDHDHTSDHGSFWAFGKPAVLAGEEYFCEQPLAPCDWDPACLSEDFNPNWHTPSDTVNTLDPSIIAETSKSMVGVMAFCGIKL